MTIVSMPSRAASASGSWLTVPQSTVTSSVAPRAGERADRVDIRPVAFEQAVGDVDDRIDPGEAQEARQRRRRGRAVDVVVAEDRDRLAAHRPRPRSAPPPRPCPRARSDRASARARSDRDSAATSSISTPRPASTRASRSGRSCRCAIASARAAPRSSSRSRQARPVADCSTPRKWRRSPDGSAAGGLDKTDNIGLLCGRISRAIVRN